MLCSGIPVALRGSRSQTSDADARIGGRNFAEYRLIPAGDTALVVEFGNIIERRVSATVLALDSALRRLRLDGIAESVPSFRSLLVHYDPLVLSTSLLCTRLSELIPSLQVREDAGRLWRIPACYDLCFAPDLEQVARRTGLSSPQIVECHSATTYHVYMLGFLPGMAYLGDLPAELVLPRRAAPRVNVPAGSLAIATTMTCVYPMDTPAGWHLIGRCPIPFLKQDPEPSVLLAAGDKLTFVPVSRREYEEIVVQIAAGTLRIVPVHDCLEAAA